ncbi:MAG: patatin-like phospholipase family protein [Thermaurantiacus sp.]
MTVLVLQGGGALGAYHLGVCEELATLDLAPDWVAGISIGAINAALIAGNRPGERLQAMATFWDRVSHGLFADFFMPELLEQNLWSEGAALWTATTGVPGFFKPRFPMPKFQPAGSMGAISYYDTAPLRETLMELVDFDWLNDGPMRFSVGAVSVTTGRMHFFDNRGGPDHCRITVDHVMASGALPPGFPPIEIDGDWYWDGGVASNAPLQHVLDEAEDRDKNIFQVDLFPAEGPRPATLLDAEIRAQDIRFSSRTRLGTNQNTELSGVRAIIREVIESCHPDLDKLPPERRRELERFAREPCIDIVQIVYRDKAYTGKARGYEFSRRTMEAHRAAGRRDASRVLAIRDWREPPASCGVHEIDVTADAEIPVFRRKN